MTKHYTEQKDIVILQEIINSPPFAVAHGKSTAAWETLAKTVSTSIDREVSARSVHERFDMIVKKFKQDEGASKATSGTSTIVTAKDRLIAECVELMKASESSKAKKSRAKLGARDFALVRVKDGETVSNQRSGPTITDDDSIEELEPVPAKRSRGLTLLDVLGESLALSRNLQENILIYMHAIYEQKKEALNYEMKRHSDEMKFRWEQLDFQKELLQNEKDARKAQEERQQRREAAQEKKDKLIIKLLIALVNKLTDNNAKRPKEQ